MAELWVSLFYHGTLLQWLVTRARLVTSDSAPEALSRLAELERHLPALSERGINTVDNLAALADAQLQELADALSVSTDDLLRWRTEADERRQLGNISFVAYTINPTFIDFDAYESVAVSIQFDGRGLSVIFPPGSDVQHESAECRDRGDPIDVRPGLPCTLGDWRQMMTRVNEDDQGFYRFQPDNIGDWAGLPALLEEMAEMGANLYTAVFNDTNTAECLRQVVEERPRTIEVANISRDQIVPWNGLYELPLMEQWEVQGTGLRRQVCMRWRDQGHQKPSPDVSGQTTWELDYATCRHAADCPRHTLPGESEDDYRRRIGVNICVYGFWGFKHRVQQPIGAAQVEGKHQPGPALRLLIEVQDKPQVGVIGNKKIGYYPSPHRDTLAGLEGLVEPPAVRFADTLHDIEATLKDPALHVVYFYCHGDTQGHLPRLIVGEDDIYINARTLDFWRINWPTMPLVFVNACESVAYSPASFTDLIQTFRGRRASGVVGAEIKVFPMLAHWFGEEFLRRFLLGFRVGSILVDLRLKLLEQANPMGLVYTAHALAGLQLVPAAFAPLYLDYLRHNPLALSDAVETRHDLEC